MIKLGYTDYLKQMLLPLGIYDLEEGIGAEEIRVIGKQFDELFDTLEELSREAVTEQAESYGLKNYEALLPYMPAYITAQDERNAVLALLRIRGGCFTRELLEKTLSGCGISASIAESGIAMTVAVGFPKNRGIPEGFDKLKKRIEEIVPCHLAVEYSFNYTTWQELMAKLPSWTAITENTDCWREFEIYE
ncbi:MAG: DUF2313 domain-containing protein [Clostridia bacterium]|nr:DUF2313 domain-containing protein [Clostridia bacterium]